MQLQRTRLTPEKKHQHSFTTFTLPSAWGTAEVLIKQVFGQHGIRQVLGQDVCPPGCHRYPFIWLSSRPADKQNASIKSSWAKNLIWIEYAHKSLPSSPNTFPVNLQLAACPVFHPGRRGSGSIGTCSSPTISSFVGAFPIVNVLNPMAVKLKPPRLLRIHQTSACPSPCLDLDCRLLKTSSSAIYLLPGRFHFRSFTYSRRYLCEKLFFKLLLYFFWVNMIILSLED